MGGTIEPHPTAKALVLSYKLEAQVFNEPGQTMVEESKVFSTWTIVLCVLLILSH